MSEYYYGYSYDPEDGWYWEISDEEMAEYTDPESASKLSLQYERNNYYEPERKEKQGMTKYSISDLAKMDVQALSDALDAMPNPKDMNPKAEARKMLDSNRDKLFRDTFGTGIMFEHDLDRVDPMYRQTWNRSQDRAMNQYASDVGYEMKSMADDRAELAGRWQRAQTEKNALVDGMAKKYDPAWVASYSDYLNKTGRPESALFFAGQPKPKPKEPVDTGWGFGAEKSAIGYGMDKLGFMKGADEMGEKAWMARDTGKRVPDSSVANMESILKQISAEAITEAQRTRRKYDDVFREMVEMYMSGMGEATPWNPEGPYVQTQ